MKQILTLILITLGIMTQAQEKVYLGSSTDGDKIISTLLPLEKALMELQHGMREYMQNLNMTNTIINTIHIVNSNISWIVRK